MEAPSRTKNSSLNSSVIGQELQDDACSFEFFQAVTLLQRLLADLRPVGKFSNPEDEAIQFRVKNQLGFPASQIQQIEWQNDAPAQMLVNFMGLTGPMGVLPYTYTELILERLRVKDSSLQSFFDIFNHRSISLFYRAWQKYRFPVTYSLGEQDLFTRYLLDLIGLGTDGMQDRQAIPDESLLNYVALLGMQSRSAAALEQLIGDYFEVPVECEQFRGTWYALDRATQCCMEEKQTESDQLGTGAVVGDEVWEQQSRVRIKLGPLTVSRYCDFLPDGSAYGPLKALTRLFSNDEVDFEVQLILKREETPRCEINLDASQPPKLGWITWLKSVPLQRDPDETILNF